MAVQSDAMESAGPFDRAKALSAFKFGDVTFYWITRACAISVLLILGGIIVSLIAGAWPAIREFGGSFLFTSRWAPANEGTRFQFVPSSFFRVASGLRSDCVDE